MKDAGSMEEHWDRVYMKTPDEKLGWYESDLSPTMGLVIRSGIPAGAHILNVGSGNTTLIDELLKHGFSNLTATDISRTALHKLEDRIKPARIRYLTDDLTNPTTLKDIDPVDLWIDRAVLHFFTRPKEQETYFNLLKRTLKQGGFAIIAQFSLNGAEICSGLPVFRYSKEMLKEKLGSGFELIDSFEHCYINPSGGERPYIYALFRKASENGVQHSQAGSVRVLLPADR